MENDTPRRVQLSRAKGWRMPENTVKVDRSTKWGNPWIPGAPGHVLIGGQRCRIGPEVTQSGAVDRHRRWLLGEFEFEHRVLTSHPIYGCVPCPDSAPIRSALDDLRGKNLACWCGLGAPCHADTLLELANLATPLPLATHNPKKPAPVAWEPAPDRARMC